MIHRQRKRVLAIAACIMTPLIAAALWLYWIGAFGGQLYFDIPAKGVAAGRRPDVAVILLSGDMGFRTGMGPQVADRIASAGIAVTGVSSLVHFRIRRSPAEVVTFVEKAMAHARRVSGARQLVLVGQSYGADMLHVALAAMPPSRRRDMKLVALVVPTDTIYYQISPGETFEWDRPDAMAITTARRLDWLPVLCIQGVEERNSLCPLLTLPNVHKIALPGGHPLHRDGDAVATVLLRAIKAPTAVRQTGQSTCRGQRLVR